MTRQEIIDVFIIRGAPADRPELRRTLEKMSFEQLEQAHQALISHQELEAKEEELLRIQAESAVFTGRSFCGRPFHFGFGRTAAKGEF